MSLDASALRRLRNDLRSPDAEVRAAALAKLNDVMGESTREIVAEALISENAEVRAHAERLLARLDTMQ